MRTRWPRTAQLVPIIALAVGIAVAAPPFAAADPLFDRIGIGADWGPHWSASPAAIDVRDNQADGAFPAEICLLHNAGFKTIRMYGENAATWIAVLDAVDDFNSGKLNCDPAGGPPVDCTTTGSCMSVVYQVGICGPDPRSLAWNGSYTDLDQVKCYEVGTPLANES
ncbi:MAG TPA: hypothetical protein VMS64_03880, partial [Candidatus Methylomirabilis sp.]|nr:hypothetical protein [Candidatus Methylomirabilis sp.]